LKTYGHGLYLFDFDGVDLATPDLLPELTADVNAVYLSLAIKEHLFFVAFPEKT
jgi:hypothetical protein